MLDKSEYVDFGLLPVIVYLYVIEGLLFLSIIGAGRYAQAKFARFVLRYGRKPHAGTEQGNGHD